MMTRSTCPLLLSALALGCLDTEPVDLGSDTTRADDGTSHETSTTTDLIGDAEPAPPCLTLTPTVLDFAGTLVGTSKSMTLTIHNCGDAPLALTGVELGAGSAAAFEFVAPTPLPVLAPGATLDVTIVYTPTAAAALDESGEPIREQATLVVSAGAARETAEVSGYGLGSTCPTPVITVAEGTEVAPGTTLHLSGVSSIGATPIVRWEWTVIQPAGSASVFLATATVPAPIFTPELTGLYTFRLEVVDELGVRSCAPAELEVIVHTDVALRVELSWSTGLDPDPAPNLDEAPDLDLHLLHPHASGYFDDSWDAYWHNPSPNWGGAGPLDDPALLADDMGHDGVEVIELAIPEQAARYCIGVHFVPKDATPDVTAYTTVRIYIDGALRWALPDVELVQGDMWDVACVAWPGAEPEGLLDATGSPRITPGVRLPGSDVD
ncbi:MAG: choice-of-anchor D domain-containing protein [Deltaproteobacteria bacterium]|nr:choice-of-anchor D domain-containing protein [Deltaproteobacteria bacterium]